MSRRSRIDWYVNRLRSMPPAEIAHRVTEAGRQRRYSRRPPTPTGRAGWSETLLLAPTLRAWQQEPSLVAHWDSLLAEHMNGELRLLGQRWTLRDGIPTWHVDPVTGGTWPGGYCFDIPFRHMGADYGDVKFVWEVNRLQFVLPLAALADLREDTTLTSRCLAIADSWSDANPPYQGVAWASGIEVALRALSLVAVYELLLPAGGPPVRTLQLLEAHDLWLKAFPSRFSSANNHLVAEVVARYVLALKLEGLHSSQDLDQLEAELVDCLSSQFFADGIGAEQSPTYTAFTLEMLLVAATAGANAGRDAAAELLAGVKARAAVLATFLDRNGNAPAIGDDDEGRVLTAAIPHRAFLSRVVTWSGAGLRRVPPEERRSFPDGGYTVCRDVHDHEEVLWVLDHGPLGMGHLAAHGHADALSVWLHVDGEPIFIDAGTYLYHSGGDWRTRMRGTAAHNTLRLGQLDSSVPSGPFNWRPDLRAESRLIAQDLVADTWSVEASHSGYASRLGAQHVRRLERIGSGHYRITDTVAADGPLNVEASLLLDPALSAAPSNGGWWVTRDGALVAELVVSGATTLTELRGSEEPWGGWHSPRFGSIEASTQLRATAALPAGGRIVTDIRLAAKT